MYFQSLVSRIFSLEFGEIVVPLTNSKIARAQASYIHNPWSLIHTNGDDQSIFYNEDESTHPIRGEIWQKEEALCQHVNIHQLFNAM
mgnify:CR=1 FL=1